jgi:hypothetical protein
MRWLVFSFRVDGNVSGRRKSLWEDRVVAMEWILGRLRLWYGYGQIRNGARLRFEYGANAIC